MLVDKIRDYLKNELSLELSEAKTKITNVRAEFAEFLSVRIRRSRHETLSMRGNVLKRNVKNLRMLAPLDKITKRLQANGFLEKGRPCPKFV